MAEKPNTEVKLRRVRMLYPKCYKAETVKNDGGDGKPRYGAEFYFDKEADKEAIAQIKKAIKAAFEAKWPGEAVKLKFDNCALRDGDSDNCGRTGDLYKGHFYLSANRAESQGPVPVFRGQQQLLTDDGTIYGGCYVHAMIRFYAMEAAAGRQVNCSLEGIKFAAHGEKIGAASATAKDFEDFDEDEDDGEGAPDQWE